MDGGRAPLRGGASGGAVRGTGGVVEMGGEVGDGGEFSKCGRREGERLWLRGGRNGHLKKGLEENAKLQASKGWCLSQ